MSEEEKDQRSLSQPTCLRDERSRSQRGSGLVQGHTQEPSQVTDFALYFPVQFSFLYYHTVSVPWTESHYYSIPHWMHPLRTQLLWIRIAQEQGVRVCPILFRNFREVWRGGGRVQEKEVIIQELELNLFWMKFKIDMDYRGK